MSAPDEPSEDWVDLGGGHKYKRVRNGDANNVAGILHEAPDGCRGIVFFRGHGVSGRDEWDVVQESPLTLHPSVKLTGYHGGRLHEHHGWIREGRWEDA